MDEIGRVLSWGPSRAGNLLSGHKYYEAGAYEEVANVLTKGIGGFYQTVRTNFRKL